MHKSGSRSEGHTRWREIAGEQYWQARVALARYFPLHGIQFEPSRPLLREVAGAAVRDVFGNATEGTYRRRKGWFTDCPHCGTENLHVRLESAPHGFRLASHCVKRGCSEYAVVHAVGRSPNELLIPRYFRLPGQVAEDAGLVDAAVEATLEDALRKYDRSRRVPFAAFVFGRRQHAAHSRGELNRRIENEYRLYALRVRDTGAVHEHGEEGITLVENVPDPSGSAENEFFVREEHSDLIARVTNEFPADIAALMTAGAMGDTARLAEVERALNSGRYVDYVRRAREKYGSEYDVL